MPMIAVNIVKILFAASLYGFLFFLARAMRAHLAGPAPLAKPFRDEPSRHAGGAVPPPSPEPLRLEVTTGEGAPSLVPITDRHVIGRGATADIFIDDEYSSARHAVFDVAEGAVWVEDLGSTNGTTVDGTRIIGRTRVGVGMTVEVGSTRVTVR
ncbi:MAG: FHA domain-containing protein [Actinobacteria bacterium]|nr:FHA domain-containing protein [Actinomycetota bacterium]